MNTNERMAAPPTDWTLPVVTDSQGNKWEVVWTHPVHPDCRVIYMTDVQAYAEKLAAGREVVAMHQLAGALSVFVGLMERQEKKRN